MIAKMTRRKAFSQCLEIASAGCFLLGALELVFHGCSAAEKPTPDSFRATFVLSVVNFVSFVAAAAECRQQPSRPRSIVGGSIARTWKFGTVVSALKSPAQARTAAFVPHREHGDVHYTTQLSRRHDETTSRAMRNMAVPQAASADNESAMPEATDEESQASEEMRNPAQVSFVERQYFYNKVRMELGGRYKPMVTQYLSSWKDERSSLCCVEVPLPMGMVIEESEELAGKVQVAEVIPGSNADKAGVEVGDVVRCVTAQKSDAANAANSNFAFNVLAGATTQGVEVKRAIFECDGQPFDQVMSAIATNQAENGQAVEGSGRVSMCLERRHRGIADEGRQSE